MALFQVTDYDKKVYEEELRDFLPEKMLDVHTHVWLQELIDQKPVVSGDVSTDSHMREVPLEETEENDLLCLRRVAGF